MRLLSEMCKIFEADSIEDVQIPYNSYCNTAYICFTFRGISYRPVPDMLYLLP